MNRPVHERDITEALNALGMLDDKYGHRAALNAEKFRREPNGGFNTFPRMDGVPEADWANYGRMVDLAVHHLNEGLPGGQKQRVEYAMELLRTGYEGLKRELRARGLCV